MQNYYQKEIETASPEQIRAWQDERLVKTVRHVWDNVEFYRKRMEEAGVTPDDIQGVKDLHKLPFITKDDLRECYPYGLLAADLNDCVRIHSTSGTTGKRVVAFYTQNDIDLWEDCCARAIVAAGGTEEDVVQVCYGYGLFTGGAGLDGGSHKMGALTLPMSSGNTDRQLMFMTDLGATILCCTPSYASYLAECVVERGLRDQIKLKSGIFGAEAWTEEMRRDIEDKLGIRAYDIYGLTEISGPGMAFECSEQTGMHINEDHFIAEIINPVTGILSREKCSCGRPFVTMSKPMGRSDDMLIVKGVNVFPSQIEMVLLNNGLTSNYQIIVDRKGHTDSIEIRVEMSPDFFTDKLSELTAKEKDVVSDLKSVLGIYAVVKIVDPKSIERSEGKAVRVIDRRNLYQN